MRRRSSIVFLIFAIFVIVQAASGQQLTSEWFAGPQGGFGKADGDVSTAWFGLTYGIAVDRSGNIYVGDNYATVRKISSGQVTTLAGLANQTGTADGTGAQARFRFPLALTVDQSGNLWIADSYAHVVKKITPQGVVTTMIGHADQAGSTDGPAATALLNNPTGLVFDPAGTLYIADAGNCVVRALSTSGTVSTIAGTAGWCGIVDGTGSAARLQSLDDITIDPSGNLFVSQVGDNVVRKITPQRAVTTFAGRAGFSGSSDGTGSAARFHYPRGLASDANGNIYVADSSNDTIRKITPAGVVTTVAGSAGFYGDVDGHTYWAVFNAPERVALDGAGNIYVSDCANLKVRKIDLNGDVTTIAGNSDPGGFIDGPAASARFRYPHAAVSDSAGNVYVADIYNDSIRKIRAGIVSTLAGNGYSGAVDGTGSAARFNSPQGLAIDAGANVYVADHDNQAIRKITPAGVVTTFAGHLGSTGSSDGTGSSAFFYGPAGIATDSAGNFYVTDQYNATVRKITPAGVVTTLAGLAGARGNTDGIGNAARFNVPIGIAVDGAGNVYVSDSNAIRRVTQAGAVTTVAGNPSQSGYVDGAPSTARFNNPGGLACDAAGNVYVADSFNDTIRRIGLDGTVSTVLGVPNWTTTEDGTGTEGQSKHPTGLHMLASGDLLVCESGTNKIRLARPAISTAAMIDSATSVTGSIRQLGTTDSTATTFNWRVLRRPAGSVAAFSSATIAAPTFTPDVDGLFTLQLRASSAAGSRVSNVDLTATCVTPPMPTVTSSSGSLPACANTPVILDAGEGYTSYQWSTGEQTRTITVAPAATTAYQVTGFTGSCPSAAASYTQTIAAPPSVSVSLEGTSVICSGQSG
ncbi:MAG TPA: hypothetical protein VGJ82_14415, partial [Thermoanaerobaculia bacterium]